MAKRAAPTPAATESDDGALADAENGFRIEAPPGFALTVHDGVYVRENGDRSLSFSRSATSAAPAEFGEALLAQLGARLRRPRGPLPRPRDSIARMPGPSSRSCRRG